MVFIHARECLSDTSVRYFLAIRETLKCLLNFANLQLPLVEKLKTQAKRFTPCFATYYIITLLRYWLWSAISKIMFYVQISVWFFTGYICPRRRVGNQVIHKTIKRESLIITLIITSQGARIQFNRDLRLFERVIIIWILSNICNNNFMRFLSDFNRKNISKRQRGLCSRLILKLWHLIY